MFTHRPARLTFWSPTVTPVGLPTPYPIGLLGWFPRRPNYAGCQCAYVPRDPLAPIRQAREDLAAAKAGITAAQEQAQELVRQARLREQEARAELHRRMVVAAARDGVRQVDLVKEARMTREAVRRILRAGGVEPAE